MLLFLCQHVFKELLRFSLRLRFELFAYAPKGLLSECVGVIVLMHMTKAFGSKFCIPMCH